MLKRTVLAKSLLVAFSGTTALYGVSASAQSTTPSTQVAPAATAASGAAPSTPATRAAPGGEQLQSVVVTGSMIRRTNAETAEAVTVITTKSLKDMGITTVEQAMQQIASNQSNITTATAVSTWGTGGASFANLRGLGASKTLVLVDGQRLANNVISGSAVDLNSIPFAAIDRIEVLREGASSIYGADAIAGVINFITKKDYQGGEINITGTKPQDAGGASGSTDITWGKGDLSVDGYNLLISANFAKQNELRAAQRKFANTGFDAARGLTNQNGPSGPWPGGYTDANGNVFQTGYPTCAGNPHLNTSLGYCAYEYSAAVDLIPPSSQTTGLIAFNKALDANNTLGIQYFYSQSKVKTWGGPAEYAGFTMNPSSPFFPTAANSTPMPGTSSTATPDLNDPISVGWTDPNNNRYQADTNVQQRLLLTLTGEKNGWDYGTAFDYSTNRNRVYVTGGYANLSVLAPNNILSNLINPFGPQPAAGQALINSSYLNGDLASGDLTLADVNGHASHKVGDWFGAGKPATLGLGLDARRETINYNPTDLAATLYTSTFYPPQTITGARESEAVYAELNVPVTKTLEFTVSDREDRYSDFGSTNNGKVSFRFQPIEMLTFRGAASTGFRAPSLVDLFAPQVFGAAAGQMQGPGCTSNPPVYNAVFTQSNCTSQGMALSGGNPTLKPEKSKNFDLGFVLEPVRDLGITVDYFKILVKDEIQYIPGAIIYSNPGSFSSDYKLNSSGSLTQAPAAPVACANGPSTPTCGYIIQTTQNTGGITTSGFDLSVNYRQRTSFGLFRFGLEGTYVASFRIQEYKDAPWISTRGQFNGGNQPAFGWQHLLTVDWTQGNWGAGISEHFLSSYTDEFPDANGNPLKVRAYSLWNGYGTYKVTDSMSILVGIKNIFNTSPGFSNQTSNWQAGYNPVFSDPIGRAFYAKATYEF